MGDHWIYLAFQSFWNIFLKCFRDPVKARKDKQLKVSWTYPFMSLVMEIVPLKLGIYIKTYFLNGTMA